MADAKEATASISDDVLTEYNSKESDFFLAAAVATKKRNRANMRSTSGGPGRSTTTHQTSGIKLNGHSTTKNSLMGRISLATVIGLYTVILCMKLCTLIHPFIYFALLLGRF